MATEFKLPDVGEGIDAAELVEWHVAVGDTVAENQPLVDVQTDKAIVEIPCPVAGTVLSISGGEGDRVPVGTVLAVFGGAGEEAAATADAPATTAPPAAAPPAAGEAPASDGAAATTSPAGASAGGEQEPTAAPPPAASARPLASPAVRRLARERGIDLREVAGSGPGGRIRREDLDVTAAPAAASPPAAGVTPPGRGAAVREDQVVPLRGTRRVIARNMVEAWQAIPHIIDFREADLSNLLAARRGLRERGEELSTFALLAKIAATAARRHPHVNASLDAAREEITVHGAVHLAVAIASPDGLVTPVVRDADRKSAVAIGAEIAALAEAARNRKLTAAQLRGGTLTVNNYGALGSTFSTPIIPPGQVVNLGFGKLEERPKAAGGEVVVAPLQWVTCSGDHRVLDGEHVAAYVNEVVALIEAPTLLLGDLV